MLHSVVQYYAEHERYKCGYCRRPDTNYSHGMWAYTLTVSDYQDLIDRGWRRSGKYCYKPSMDVTCCPMYTIRCRALEFKPSKSQKKVLKCFNKFLANKETINVNRKMSTCSNESEILGDGFEEGVEQFVETTKEHQYIDEKDVRQLCCDDERLSKVQNNSKGELSTNMECNNIINVCNETPKKITDFADSNNVPCKKAKQLRLERKLKKMKDKGIDVTDIKMKGENKEKQIEQFINELPEDVKQKLKIKLVRVNPPSREWLATAKETHNIYVKYQTIIHNDKPEKCTEPKFTEFLVSSPLQEEYSETGPACGYGSFHQQYWFEDKLIAVGVVDILPKCLSSVYFFYDPQYMKLTLGTYGALREIEFTRHLHSLSPELKYYYMGFYIHSCRKMRYKGNFFPSDLLCPETYKWFPLKDSVLKLESAPYSRLDPDIDSVDLNYPKENDIDDILVWVKGVVMPYKKYIRKIKDHDSEDVREYLRLVGAKSAKSLVLIR